MVRHGCILACSRAYGEGVGDIGPAELLIILAVVLLLFGSKKLPELARSMGEAAHEFRKAIRHTDEDDPPDPAS